MHIARWIAVLLGANAATEGLNYAERMALDESLEGIGFATRAKDYFDVSHAQWST